MTLLRYLVGVLLLGVALGPIGAGAWALGRRLLPDWSGAPARIVEIVIALSTALVVAELLGIVDLYRTAPMVIALAAVGLIEWWWARRTTVAASVGEHRTKAPAQMGRAGAVATLVVIAVLVADWGTRTADALNHGMTTIDTLWYHMPSAVRFVQTGSLRHLHFVDGYTVVTAYFPANSPLLHGMGVMMLGSDLLSPMMNMAWLAFALVAGWCIGRPYRAGPVTLAGVAAVLALPGMVATQPGGAYTDVVGLALLLAALAIIVEANQREQAPLAAYAVAALAAGWALGTKYTFLVPVAALTVGVIVIARRGQRWRTLLVWIAGLFVTGSFWYLRNWVLVGNPLPSFGVHLGPISFKSLTQQSSFISTVAHFVTNGSMWSRFFWPGFARFLGPMWWAVLAILVAGMLVGLVVGPTRIHRLVAFVALASFVGFVVTPQFIQLLGMPLYFDVNLRYASAALGLAAVALPITAAARPQLRWWVLGLYGVVLAGTQLSATIWPAFGHPWKTIAPVVAADWPIGIGAAAVVLVVGVFAVMARRRPAPDRSSILVALGVGVVVIIVGGAVLHSFYLDNRYAHDSFESVISYRWARDLHGQRIGVYGTYGVLQYPLYGRDLSNHVQFLGITHPDGSFTPITDCKTWRRTLNAGRYDYVELTKAAAPNPPEWAWTSTDPATTRVATPDAPRSVVYRIRGRLDPESCPRPAKL